MVLDLNVASPMEFKGSEAPNSSVHSAKTEEDDYFDGDAGLRFSILWNAEAGADGAEEEVEEEFEEKDRVGKEQGVITRQLFPLAAAMEAAMPTAAVSASAREW